MASYEIRRYRPGDEHALLDTFNVVFGASDPTFEKRTLSEWRWQYEENPAGMRLWLALQDGVVAASFAAQPNRVLSEGREVIFGQLIDSMVHPEHRLGLKRPGLFVETALQMFADQRSDPVVFGYPNKQAWRIGRMFLRYDFVRRQHIQVRELGGVWVRTPGEVERIDSFGPEVRELYARCARDWGASVIRDEAYLNWRFARHPRFRYRMLAVRDGERLAGYAVYRPGNWPMPGVGMLIDFLVPAEEVEVGRLLCDAVLAEGLADGVPMVVQVLPEWSPWCERFQRWFWPVFPTDYLMGGCIADPHFDMFFLRDRWWYTLAELDLV